MDQECMTWRGRIRRGMEKHYSLAGAEAFVGKVRPGETVLGVSNGQFSLSDVLEACIDLVGECEIDLATWTAAGADAARMIELSEMGRVKRMRWVVDSIFVKRQPQLVKALIARFGKDALRVTKTHAKFAVLRGEELNVVVRTSMNLNANPRLEYLEITEGEELARFFGALVDRVFEAGSGGDRVAIGSIGGEDEEENAGVWW